MPNIDDNICQHGNRIYNCTDCQKRENSINNTVCGHRQTDRLSDLGKHIIESCPKSYVNEYGQVIDPCHVWFSEAEEPTSWNVGNE